VKYKTKLLKKTFTVTLGILILSILCAIVGVSGLAGSIESDNKITAEHLADKLIRLHVIANGNSPEDQQLKLKVRDAILLSLSSKFQNIDDINLSRKFIKENLDHIEEIAKEEIKKNGKDYDVKAMFGKFPFPAKTYGYVTLPAGEYEALRVIIGNGKGANWWCVLFPPLCFVDITQKTSTDNKDELRVAMNHASIQQELKGIKNDVHVEIRFKFQELWQETKAKLNQAIKLALK